MRVICKRGRYVHPRFRLEEGEISPELGAHEAERIARDYKYVEIYRGSGAKKQDTGGENDRQADLESLTKDELAKLAEERGVTVEGTGKDGAVLKADLVKALS